MGRFGSYNFEHAAHDRLAEAMLASRDARATRPAAEIFAELRRHPDNLLVTPRVVADRPAKLEGQALVVWLIQAVAMNLKISHFRILRRHVLNLLWTSPGPPARGNVRYQHIRVNGGGEE